MGGSMRLRNKNTGETIEVVAHREGDFTDQFNSLAELNKDWEDYKPKEPLIKDGKVRNAVRAWAVANDVDEVLFDYWWNSDVSAEMRIENAEERRICIKFNVQKIIGEQNRIYTIEELCGSEEE